MRQGNIGRIAAFFAVAFGSILVPMAALFLSMAVFPPRPYLADETVLAHDGDRFAHPEALFGADVSRVERDARTMFPGALAAAVGTFPDQTKAAIAAYPTAEGAQRARDGHMAATPWSTRNASPWEIRYTRSDNGERGFAAAVGAFLIAVEGASKTLVTERLAALPAIRLNPHPGFLKALFDEHLGWFFGALGLYGLLQLLIWPRLASWAARVPAEPGRARLSLAELRNRLLEINRYDVPFHVACGKRPGELVAEWKYVDSRWLGVMAAGGLRSLYRLRMRLDEASRRVRAQEYCSSVSWSAGPGGPAIVSIGASFFRGINFLQYDRGVAYGLFYREGAFHCDLAYDYRFSAAEVRTPLIQVITESGWDYVPVMSFSRLLNG